MNEIDNLDALIIVHPINLGQVFQHQVHNFMLGNAVHQARVLRTDTADQVDGCKGERFAGEQQRLGLDGLAFFLDYGQEHGEEIGFGDSSGDQG